MCFDRSGAEGETNIIKGATAGSDRGERCRVSLSGRREGGNRRDAQRSGLSADGAEQWPAIISCSDKCPRPSDDSRGGVLVVVASGKRARLLAPPLFPGAHLPPIKAVCFARRRRLPLSGHRARRGRQPHAVGKASSKQGREGVPSLVHALRCSPFGASSRRRLPAPSA